MIRKIEKLAYRYYQGSNDFPTIVFLPGYNSNMQGTKAQYVFAQCEKRGQSCLLLDYSGHGESGGRFEDGSIGVWRDDALALIDAVTQGDLILVGSSMGGWIALLTAMKRPLRVQGVIGIAAAPDFTRAIQAKLPDQFKKDLTEKGFFSVPSGYGGEMVITQKLLDDGETHCLLDKNPDLRIPVMLIQGKRDAEVAWQTAEKIKNSLAQANVEIVYIEDGDHRLSREEDLKLIGDCVEKMSALLHAGGG